MIKLYHQHLTLTLTLYSLMRPTKIKRLYTTPTNHISLKEKYTKKYIYIHQNLQGQDQRQYRIATFAIQTTRKKIPFLSIVRSIILTITIHITTTLTIITIIIIIIIIIIIFAPCIVVISFSFSLCLVHFSLSS
ncbi:hypothetical protein F4703DRAFT_1891051 [Phycomyces blakesleeanus]